MIPLWLALVALAFVSGVSCGWFSRVHTTNDQYLTTMAARYRAQEAYMEARTASAIAELENYSKRVKHELTRKPREGKKHAKRNHS